MVVWGAFPCLPGQGVPGAHPMLSWHCVGAHPAAGHAAPGAAKATPFSSLLVQFFISFVHLTAPVLGSGDSQGAGSSMQVLGAQPQEWFLKGSLAGSHLYALSLAGINQLALLKN